jgi:hypothetical protein
VKELSTPRDVVHDPAEFAAGHGTPPPGLGAIARTRYWSPDLHRGGAHSAREFIHRYTDNLATLGTHLREAAEAGEIAALTPAAIEQEVHMVTALLDGMGLQWLLDPSTDVAATVSPTSPTASPAGAAACEAMPC